MTLAPDISLALALHQHPGRYALLLGSGISRSAQVPTGWEITLGLIQKWADAEGSTEACKADPSAWYRTKTGKDPDYADLLELIAPTPDERQSLLRQYFEPASDNDREEGKRSPTAAHRAIARMAKAGTIKVIVTLNFDRLLEEALVSEGQHPNVVSSEDGAKGMVPLNHSDLTVVKLHGDYLDPRLRNTPAELSAYPPALQNLLDEILERYGLIICGWSADWDAALRESIRRTTRHRYQSFWMAHGKPSVHAESVIEYRQASIIRINNADEAFDAIAENVASLNAGTSSDPITPLLAIQAAKRFVAENRFDIRLHDLIQRETTNLRDFTAPDRLPHSYSAEEYLDRFKERVLMIEAASAKLLGITAVGVYHGGPRLDEYWPKLIIALARKRAISGSYQPAFERLSRYPATLHLYAICICAMTKGRFDLVKAVLWDTEISIDGYRVPDSVCHHLTAPDSLYHDAAQCLKWKSEKDKGRKWQTPGSDHIYDSLWQYVQPVVLDKHAYDDHFDQFELLIALCNAAAGEHVTYGRFSWDYSKLKSLGTREEPGPLAKSIISGGFFDRSFDKLFDAFKIVTSRGEQW